MKRKKQKVYAGMSIVALFVSVAALIVSCRVRSAAQRGQGEKESQATEASLPELKDTAYLMLINASHPLPEDYEPQLTRLNDWPLSVATPVYDDLCAMLRAGREAGLSFQICSAYRTREEQRVLFEEDVQARMTEDGMSRTQAVAETARYTMQPGCSEHESGFALDIVSTENQRLDDTQERTEETQWLHAHCWEYGFILRYPKDKETITGVAYESWHYRYVGREAAELLTKQGLTLEEYTDQNG